MRVVRVMRVVCVVRPLHGLVLRVERAAAQQQAAVLRGRHVVVRGRRVVLGCVAVRVSVAGVVLVPGVVVVQLQAAGRRRRRVEERGGQVAGHHGHPI